MNINKRQIESLIDEVIIKFQGKFLKEYISNEDEKFRHDVLLSNFAIMFFDDEQKKLHSNFKELLKFYESFYIPYQKVKYTIAHFLRDFEDWVTRHEVAEKIYLNKVKSLYVEILNIYPYSVRDIEEDNFVFIEDAGVDEAINNMHYDDSQKISASEYFSTNPINSDDFADIAYIKDLIEELLDTFDSFSQEFVDEFVTISSKLLTSLQFVFSTKEFSDMGVALNNLVATLNEINIDNEYQQLMAYDLLIAFAEDLLKWIKSIFMEQSAVDIHYLDASLLANAVQFGISFQNTQDEINEEEDDDDFIF